MNYCLDRVNYDSDISPLTFIFNVVMYRNTINVKKGKVHKNKASEVSCQTTPIVFISESHILEKIEIKS